MPISLDQVRGQFGLDPETIGLRHRGWWIVAEVEDEEKQGNAKVGYLCVIARDGGGNPVDVEAFRHPNCVGSATDGFDYTFRYYYFRPLGERKE